MAGREDVDRVILMIAKIHTKEGGLVQTKSTHERPPKTMRSRDAPIPPHLEYLPTRTFTSSYTTVALVCGVVITSEGLLTKLGTQLRMGGTFLFSLAFDWLRVGLVSLFWFLCGAGDVLNRTKRDSTMLQLVIRPQRSSGGKTTKGRPFLMCDAPYIPSLAMPWSVNSYKADKLSYDEDVSHSSSASPPCDIFRPTIELPLDKLLDPCNEKTPSASSALDTNTTANAVGDSDVATQDLAGAYMHTSISTLRTDTYPFVQDPSSPIPKAGATLTLSPTATSTPNANTYRHDRSQRHH
ncbi:hypothetical protein EDC04DRAFT_2670711 [Pisolithus marmoratus]|nr:hypothetical protein EDC04DRAFT_2783844 [Pisolithus marmoratus]KAI6041161.1 hypothetical protein EDC04DRAFT_2670711 [Pisolithus marmoratus]